MSKTITLKDIAKRAGVSYQTVSKVIHNQIQVTPEVRERIQAAIEELGYRPNAAAQNLRTQSSHLIGYSWKSDRQNHSSPILEQFQHSIVENAEDSGYHILLFPHLHPPPARSVPGL
jgi:DNA-binding LacI/PurR family transcriptional regulator